jgi:hypothetical protein
MAILKKKAGAFDISTGELKLVLPKKAEAAIIKQLLTPRMMAKRYRPVPAAPGTPVPPVQTPPAPSGMQ